MKHLKGLFGGPADEPDLNAGAGPMGLRIGRAVSMDMMRLRLEERALAISLPSETLVISGYGIVDLGGGASLHRFYDDHHTMLQFLCEFGTEDSAIREIMLFRPWDAVSPTSDAEWRVWDGPGAKIGSATFAADGHVSAASGAILRVPGLTRRSSSRRLRHRMAPCGRSTRR
jgi:hypothetical protein